MKNNTKSSEHVRPMLEAMARSIDAARAKRTAPTTDAWSRSSEGTTSVPANFAISVGSSVAANGKAKAKTKEAESPFFRDREQYRKAS